MYKLVSLVFWIFASNKKQDSPYLSTILLLTLMAGMAIFSVFILIGGQSISIFDIQDRKARVWITAISITTPIVIIISLIFRKRTLLKYKFSVEEIKRGKRNLILAFSALFIVFVGILFMRVSKIL